MKILTLLEVKTRYLLKRELIYVVYKYGLWYFMFVKILFQHKRSTNVFDRKEFNTILPYMESHSLKKKKLWSSPSFIQLCVKPPTERTDFRVSLFPL